MLGKKKKDQLEELEEIQKTQELEDLEEYELESKTDLTTALKVLVDEENLYRKTNINRNQVTGITWWVTTLTLYKNTMSWGYQYVLNWLNLRISMKGKSRNEIVEVSRPLVHRRLKYMDDDNKHYMERKRE